MNKPLRWRRWHGPRFLEQKKADGEKHRRLSLLLFREAIPRKDLDKDKGKPSLPVRPSPSKQKGVTTLIEIGRRRPQQGKITNVGSGGVAFRFAV
jgi:hypothetical protein